MATEQKEEPPKLFILPDNASPDAKFILLRNPKDRQICRYYFCPKLGLYEFTKISAPAADPRSVLFSSPCNERLGTEGRDTIQGDFKQRQESADVTDSEKTQAEDSIISSDLAQGYVSKKAEMFIATPVDLNFILLPILYPVNLSSRNESAKRLFRPLEDLLEVEGNDNTHLSHILDNQAFRHRLEEVLAAICDSVDAGDEKMFRLSEEKLIRGLLRKAEKMVSIGLPASLEERFVHRALDVPVLNVKREDSSISLSTETREKDIEAEVSDTVDSQSSTTTTSSGISTTVSEVSTVTTTTSASQPNGPDNIIHLLKLRTALSFILASYVPKHLTEMINERLSTLKDTIDFAPLDEHLKHVASRRADALASRSLSDFSRKRSAREDEDAAETKAEKKRRLEEEEKRRKAAESRGVRELKKVNVAGMKKMSDFFGRAAPKKKA